MQLTFAAIDETRPGVKWQARFRRMWPGYRRWFMSGGGHLGPSLAESERALRRHMPEMLPVWERLVRLGGDDALAARFLTGWCPPRYVVGCSQVAHEAADGVWLVRNYDLDPSLNEGVLWRTAWTGRGVLATGECLSGAADGVNDAGLAVSLAFGGRPAYGSGFGIPHVVRYLLEVAESTADVVEILCRLPVHMAYNLTLADRSGDVRSVMVGPDRPAEVTARPLATNHQDEREPADLWRFGHSRERSAVLGDLLDEPALDGPALRRAFLARPLYATDYACGFGTVYTAAWRADAGEVTLCWPGHAWKQSLSGFLEDSRTLRYRQGEGARLMAPRPA
jgi:predicted choloylglycine hydrolase